MADIKLNDLQPAGVDFFEDNEGYLSELSEDELTVWGGTGGGGGGNFSILNSNVSLFNSAANTLGNSAGNSLNISF
ncbi:MAG TPA: hypothetical protein V6C85_24705 [Allocoleopsis sp.]